MILAVDPGREKTGVAVIHTDKTLIHCEIVATESIKEHIESILDTEGITTIVCGDGTNHQRVFNILDTLAKAAHVRAVLVNEKHTTEEARRRYFEVYKPTGWRRLVPKGMLYPPRPIDDMTAWIIGERYLDLYREETDLTND